MDRYKCIIISRSTDTNVLYYSRYKGFMFNISVSGVKKSKQPIQMHCSSRYKCSRNSDAFPSHVGLLVLSIDLASYLTTYVGVKMN